MPTEGALPPLIVPVILCGGSGTRLWPASRDHKPKQFLALTGERSLLQETARRALAISGAIPERLVAVTLDAFADDVAAQLPDIRKEHVLCEPAARHTAAAVALAALHAARTFGGDALMWVLPADHHIGDEVALGQAVRAGVKEAARGALVTFGVTPTRADTGYGYIRAGAGPDGDTSPRPIESFVEKPDAATARDYFESSRYFWNSGMFLFSARTALAQFERHAPNILAAVGTAAGKSGTARPDADAYAAVPALAFDRAVMERSKDSVVVPLDAQWSDIGSWNSLWDARAKDASGNARRGDTLAAGVTDCLIESLNGRLVACAGLKNIVVVDTGDAVLVADRTDTESLTALLNALKARASSQPA